MRVALVHDWLLGMRGGEKVLEAIARMYPDAELFTLIADRQSLSPILQQRKIHTSWLQRLPGVRSYYRTLLPWMPGAIEQLDVTGFDLIISSSHCVAKGVMVPSGAKHLCYCHSPMRYAWNLQELYISKVPAPLRPIVRKQLEKLREWDRKSSDRVHQFIANGKTVQERIRSAYSRDSLIIHPPVDTDFYHPDTERKREDYYLAVSALAPNKRIDLAVLACMRQKKKLVIIGSGQESKRLQQMADPNLIQFLGWQSDEVIREHYQRCKALLFPGEEDFGIVPLEANACGTAVIAYGHGGATETIQPLGEIERPTGIWFNEATVDSLCAAIEQFEQSGDAIEPKACRQNALHYRSERFTDTMQQAVKTFMS
ncbi:MAG: glycosyltransferase [Planctomycetia bacterium]|nr:glycosyltransferase [Planctomycetia bacterium]